MTTILVTGCAGFIGSHVCRRLLANGKRVVGIDSFDPFYGKEVKRQNMSDISADANFTFHELDICGDLSLLRQYELDVVVHLAARVGVSDSIAGVTSYFETNIMGTKNILELMRSVGCSKIVFSSSSSVYGATRKEVFDESDATDKPLSPYAASKKACELTLYSYHYLFKFSVLCLRFFSVYGQCQRPDLVIHKFAQQISLNQPVTIYGNGESRRDYTFVSDIVGGVEAAIVFVCQQQCTYEVVNLGSGNPIATNQLALSLYGLFRCDPQLTYLEAKKEDMLSTCASIEKARTLLGYVPQVAFEDGLADFFGWFSCRP